MMLGYVGNNTVLTHHQTFCADLTVEAPLVPPRTLPPPNGLKLHLAPHVQLYKMQQEAAVSSVSWVDLQWIALLACSQISQF